MRGAPALVVLCGCRGILGIHGLEEGAPDGRPLDVPSVDGSLDPDGANLCPSDFMMLPGATGHRYKLLVVGDDYVSRTGYRRPSGDLRGEP